MNKKPNFGRGPGGFAIKFDKELVDRCYEFSVNFDDWTFTPNRGTPHPLPKDLKAFSAVVERPKDLPAKKR